jgi:thymidylate synthase ThyX
VIEMRASGPAEVQIRALGMKLFYLVRHVAPILFDDYRVERLESSGTEAVATDYRKV